jgi:hypothetical protein
LFACDVTQLYMANVAAGLTPGFVYPSCLVSTAAAPLGVALFIDAEMNNRGLTSVTEGKTPLLYVWLIQIFDVIVYAWLAWYLDQVIPAPTTTGDHKPWDFCLPRFLRANTGEVQEDAAAAALAAEDSVRSPSGSQATLVPPAVKVRHLKKTYPSKPAPVHALVDLSFDMADGEVTGLGCSTPPR